METAQNHPHHCCSVGEHILHSLREVDEWPAECAGRPPESAPPDSPRSESPLLPGRPCLRTGPPALPCHCKLQHGTVTVMLDKDGFEVTTYRLDGEYEDGRHPKSVTFTSDLEEDLKRRDLTILISRFILPPRFPFRLPGTNSACINFSITGTSPSSSLPAVTGRFCTIR